MIVVLKSQVNQAWNSSIEVGVRVETEDPLTGVREHCCSAYLTFVAIDQPGKKVAVPKLDTEQNPVTEQRAIDAQKRRDARLSTRVQRRTIPTTPA
jgi:acyl-CoA hydrolase